MQLRWPWKKDAVLDQPRVRAIYISPAAGEPMQAVDVVTARAQSGLQGDRYTLKAGHWQATDACELTLISEHDLRRAAKGQSEAVRARLQAGGHRRNLVIGGIKTRHLEGRTFRIGSALLRYHKPRPPCGYLDQVEGRGMCRALGRHSGICLKVLETGDLKVGDRVQWVD